jgi:hypothetical protein
VQLSRLLVLYPRWWRARYGDEMEGILVELAPQPIDRMDLARGALDAWLHPPEPSIVPSLAALAGGGLWTVAAAGILAQPTPPDWPGYIRDVVPLTLASAACLLVATLGMSLRAADTVRRAFRVVVLALLLSYGAWIAAMIGTLIGGVGSVVLGATGSAAMIATAGAALLVIRTGSPALGTLILLAAVCLLLPWPSTWLAFGACWTAIGIALYVERSRSSRDRPRMA